MRTPFDPSLASTCAICKTQETKNNRFDQDYPMCRKCRSQYLKSKKVLTPKHHENYETPKIFGKLETEFINQPFGWL